MDDNFEGMVYIILDDNSEILYDDRKFINNYSDFLQYLQELTNANGTGTKLRYEMEDTRTAEIKGQNDFINALNSLTGQGMILRLIKPPAQQSSWRCSRCQLTNSPDLIVCRLCKYKRTIY
ncbi:hypothetical protein SteCoe_4063 [Stentor coeruleus]|uniref:RanBP2-type domain-containing protein n=1 Tax=Stentor coeruleus TaxID=5963 RepID=A0A1R2CVE3_9CILI|nr:hypothetical protein SteCoe_4063 [Stentor coeruleus]